MLVPDRAPAGRPPHDRHVDAQRAFRLAPLPTSENTQGSESGPSSHKLAGRPVFTSGDPIEQRLVERHVPGPVADLVRHTWHEIAFLDSVRRLERDRA